MIYIIQLSISEIVRACIIVPGNFSRMYHGSWIFSDALCTAYLYLNGIIAPGVRYAQALITLNRFWAVTFPVSYRNRHTSKVACIIIAVKWLFLHAMFLPSLIPGRMFPKPGDRQCVLNTSFQPGVALLFIIMNFDFPEFVILALYPFIQYKVWKRQEATVTRRNRIGTMSGSKPAAHSAAGSDQPGTAVALSTINEGKSGPESRQRNRLTPYNGTLTALTVAALLLFTPNNVYYFLVYYKNYWNAVYFAVQNSLLP